LTAVADRCDVAVDDLWKALRDHGRFVAIQEVRSALTWVATDRVAAERWAARAPEAQWEAFWAVWWLTRDRNDMTPWRTPSAAGWHAQQLFEQKPAVIEMEVPVRRVLDGKGETLTAGHVRDRVRVAVPELSIKPPGETEWIVEIHPTRRPVEFTAVAGLLRMSTNELADAVKAGRVPEPHPPAVPGTDWTWFEDELSTVVPGDLLHDAI
jgi:hypothetical protein